MPRRERLPKERLVRCLEAAGARGIQPPSNFQSDRSEGFFCLAIVYPKHSVVNGDEISLVFDCTGEQKKADGKNEVESG